MATVEELRQRQERLRRQRELQQRQDQTRQPQPQAPAIGQGQQQRPQVPPVPQPQTPDLQTGPQQREGSMVSRVPGFDQLEGVRGAVRGEVESRPFIEQLTVEMSPALIGTAAGGAVGSAAGPFGTLLGAMAGGLVGEGVGQATGVAPEDDFALVASGAAPGVGRLAASGVRAAQRGGAGFLNRVPGVQAARAQIAERQAAEDFTRFSESVLASQKGLLSRPSEDLFQVLERFDRTVPVQRFQDTTQAMRDLRGQLADIIEFPAAAAASRQIDQLLSVLTREEEVPLSVVMRARSQIGALTKTARDASGTRLGASKRLFNALSNDVERIANDVGPESRVARVALAANDRFKVEAAVEEFDELVSRSSRLIPDQDAVRVNVKSLREDVRKMADPNSPRFNKNFVDGLGDALPRLQENLRVLSQTTEGSRRGAAGPGSLVIRGRTAGGGALVGGLIGGPVGAGAGALLGAQIPDMMLGLLTTERGARLMQRAAEAGRGQIDMQNLSNMSQIVAQGLLRGGAIEEPEEGERREPLPEGITQGAPGLGPLTPSPGQFESLF